MRNMILSAHILFLWSAAVPTMAQLPPDILADSYMLEVEQAFRDGDHSRARAKIQEILQLQTKHDLNLPELDYWQAKAADSMDLPEQALESILSYLRVVGREGRNYVEALKLMNRVQAVVRCKGWETEGYFGQATNEAVSNCLGTGVDLTTRDDSGRTALHRAATHTKNPAVIEALIKSGADLEALDDSGRSPLVLAVVHNENPRVIETLLNAGANPKDLDQILTASTTDPKKLERVLEPVLGHIADRGQEIQYHAEMQDFMKRVQAVARCQGWETEEYFGSATLEAVMACLSTGADLEARDDSGRMPLHRAVAHTDDASIIDVLLGAGAPPMAQDEAGFTPLHYATGRTASPVVIEALLAAGADPMAGQAREEIGKLSAGEEHTFFGREAQKKILYADAQDYNPIVKVTSPSGDWVRRESVRQGRAAIILLSLRETGEYRIKISKSIYVDPPDNETYKLRISHRTPLEMAVRNFENPAVIEAMFEAGADPRAKNDLGQTLLHQAAQKNENPAVIQGLLSNGGRPRDEDVFGRTSMHYASQNERLDVIKTLIAAGGDPKTKDKKKWRPLHHAAAYNENPAVIRALLNAGAKLEEKADDGYRALHLSAIHNENPAVTQTLIDAGAKIRSSAGYSRDTPLRWAAASNRNPEVIKVLIDAGGDLHDGTARTGDTALHDAAAYNRNPAVTKTLIAAGANPNIRNDDNDAPLHYAVRNAKDAAVIQVLIAAGATLNIRNDDGNTPLHYAAGNESPTVIPALLAAGANPMARNGSGSTPLHFAAAYNENPAMIKVLIDAGAELEARNDDGNTPLHFAARNASVPAGIPYLIAVGAELEARNDGNNTPLHQAAWHNENPAVIEALLKAGANPNVRLSNGRTPLHHAAMNNENPAVIEALLNAGANPVAQSSHGSTPLDYAVEHNDNSDVAQLLTRAGSTRTRQESTSGPGWLGAAIGIAGGTAIAAAGGGSEEALAAGTVFAEGVISGQSPGGSTTNQTAGVPPGNVGAGTGSGQCEIPGYPRPADVKNLGLSWCPATVDFQARVFALQAAGAQCAIATGSSSTPEQIQARRQEIQAACERLAALGVSDCRCP